MASSLQYVLFPSELGWMAMAGAGRTVTRLAFGYSTPAAAYRALGSEADDASRDDVWFGELVERLQAYAVGTRDDFRDIRVELEKFTDFQRRVIENCRKIPPGLTVSYAQLAIAAGCPGAARAVGNVMRSNPVPLVVPCHRVVGSGGGLGGYSAQGGLRTKRRLLDMETNGWVREAATSIAEAT